VTETIVRADRGITATYPALASSPFRIFLGSTSFSLTGMWMFSLAQGWLVLSLTDSPLMLGLVGAFWAVPNLLLSLVGGVVADRMDRRRLLLITRATSLTLTACLAYLIASGQVQVWHVFAFATLQGAIAAFDMPTTQALVPTLVRPAAIGSAIALMSANFNFTRVVGPSLAGVLVAEIGIAGCYGLAAVSGIPVLGALLYIRPVTSVVRRAAPVLESIRGGFEYLRHDRLRISILAMFLLNSLFGMAYPTLMPVVARDVVKGGPEALGLIMAASGVGSLIGTVVVATFSDMRRKGLAAMSCSVAFGLALVVFGQMTTLATAAALMVVVGIFNAAYGVLLSTILQTDLDDQYRGRVMSIFMLVVNTMPLAGLQAGALASAFGAPLAMGFNGAVVAIAGAIALVRAPWLRRA
jgi:MFS family permease